MVPAVQSRQAKRRLQRGAVEKRATVARQQEPDIQARHPQSQYCPEPEQEPDSAAHETHSTSRCRYSCQAQQAADGSQQVELKKRGQCPVHRKNRSAASALPGNPTQHTTPKR
jgi:hypothetical protein